MGFKISDIYWTNNGHIGQDVVSKRKRDAF